MPYAYLNPEDDRDVSAGSRIKKGFQAACRRAKIENFSPHKCRHTWATWHYMQHRDLNLLKDLGGWENIEMVLRYAHVNVAHRAPSIAAMPTIGAKAKAPRKAPSKPRKAGAAQAVAR